MMFAPVQRGTGMPINRLLKNSALRPEEIALLNQAFDKALHGLGLVDRSDPITEIVARKIIDVGATGVRDAATIAEIALKELRT
jgi:hypothetical protein